MPDFVDAMPGCNKTTALLSTGRPARGMGCWYPLQRTIAAGLVIVDTANPWAKGNEHLLFRNERARQLFNLRSELLSGNPGPERSAQIRPTRNRLR